MAGDPGPRTANVKPDPRHQANLKQLLQLPEAEVRRCVAIAKFNDAEFVASEVLVSLVRMRFGQGSGLLDLIVNVLYGRLMRLIDKYFGKNLQWRGIVSASSETLREATSAAWEVLTKDPKPVSFAEARFLPWVEARAEDYLQEQLAQKNTMPSYGGLNLQFGLNRVSGRDDAGGGDLGQKDLHLFAGGLRQRTDHARRTP